MLERHWMSYCDLKRRSDFSVQRVLFVMPCSAFAPLVHSQGIPHMRELSKRGIAFSLLTLEKAHWNDADCRRADEFKMRLADWGIEWHILQTRLPRVLNPNAVNLARLVPAMLRLIRRKKIDVVHCRSYLPAFALLAIRKLTGVRFLFDTRGFYPDEKLLDNKWTPGSARYRVSKWLEAKCFRHADAITVVNHRMRDILLGAYPEPGEKAAIDGKLTVIPNCADTERFRPEAAIRATMRKEYGLDDRTVFLWLVGGIRPIHMPAESIAFFLACKERLGDAILLVLTRTPHAEELLKGYGLSNTDFLVRSVDPADVPRFAQMADVGLSFMEASHHGSPVKLAEYLAMGIPVALNQGQPGFDDLVSSAGAGAVIRSCTSEGYSEAAQELIDKLQNRQALQRRCRALAENELSLHSAVDKYEHVYHSLLQ